MICTVRVFEVRKCLIPIHQNACCPEDEALRRVFLRFELRIYSNLSGFSTKLYRQSVFLCFNFCCITQNSGLHFPSFVLFNIPVTRFLLELSLHIPPRGLQYIRRYGLYAPQRRTARTKGKWPEIPGGAQPIPTGDRSELRVMINLSPCLLPRIGMSPRRS